MPDFDAIIIGAGQAGPSLAFHLAGAGMKVAVVERHLVVVWAKLATLRAGAEIASKRLWSRKVA